MAILHKYDYFFFSVVDLAMANKIMWNLLRSRTYICGWILKKIVEYFLTG